MRKFLVVFLTLMCISGALLADDAKVLPKYVGRVFVVPTYGFASDSYDTDGNKTTFDKKINFFNLGFAVEFGVADWISAAVQWAPGVTLSSDLEGAAASKIPTLMQPALAGLKYDMNDASDLFVGAKVQFVGRKAPVKSEMFRAAIAPGVAIPLTSVDFKKEVDAVMAMAMVPGAPAVDSAKFSKMDTHVFAAGWRAYFDVIPVDCARE
jgi:hypothetical protein